MEAYKALNLPFDATPEDARKAFRRMALIHHPDKGGDARIFNMIKNAYKQIIHRLSQAERQDFNAMRQAHKHQEEDRQTHVQEMRAGGGGMIDPKNFNNADFNRMFEDHRIVRPCDRGYGDWDEERETPHARDFETKVTIYEEPDQVLTSIGYETLGQGRVKDFSSGLYDRVQYTDYKKAYSTPRTEDEISRNRDYKSGDVESLKRSRGKNLEVTPEELSEFERLQKLKLKHEMDRQRRQQQQTEHGLRVGNMMYSRIKGAPAPSVSGRSQPKYFDLSR